MKAIDGALSPSLTDSLRLHFAPDAPFWREHHYDPFNNCSRSVGYFSYQTSRFDASQADSRPRNLPEHVVQAVFNHVQRAFPRLAAQCGVAEWWVHSRPHACGHQMHFDSDETFLRDGGAPTHPLVSCVIYLEEGASNRKKKHSSGPPAGGMCGGPTLITNQVLGGGLATEGWMVMPHPDRLVMFDARYLHGVVPGQGVGPQSASASVNAPNAPSDPARAEEEPPRRRLTFMIGFWKTLRARQQPPGKLGAGQHFPPRSTQGITWNGAMCPVTPEGGGGKGKGGGEERCLYYAPPSAVTNGADDASLIAVERPSSHAHEDTSAVREVDLLYVPAVWEKSNPKHPSTQPPAYDACFQGF